MTKMGAPVNLRVQREQKIDECEDGANVVTKWQRQNVWQTKCHTCPVKTPRYVVGGFVVWRQLLQSRPQHFAWTVIWPWSPSKFIFITRMILQKGENQLPTHLVKRSKCDWLSLVFMWSCASIPILSQSRIGPIPDIFENSASRTHFLIKVLHHWNASSACVCFKCGTESYE